MKKSPITRPIPKFSTSTGFIPFPRFPPTLSIYVCVLQSTGSAAKRHTHIRGYARARTISMDTTSRGFAHARMTSAVSQIDDIGLALVTGSASLAQCSTSIGTRRAKQSETARAALTMPIYTGWFSERISATHQIGAADLNTAISCS